MASNSEVEEDPSPPSRLIPDDWSAAADDIKAHSSGSLRPPVAVICGPKHAGKSTFSRYLVGILLQRYKKVAYLDTDVGQPEFTAPGLLSFTVIDKRTSGFTSPCLTNPERCFFFGDISPKRDPSMYLKYVTTLYDYYQNEYCTIGNNGNPRKNALPLVVNTPGWVKGVGYDLLVDMLRHIASTHVVKINTSFQKKNLPAGNFWVYDDQDIEVNRIEIKSAFKDSYIRSVLIQKEPRILRDERIMLYFRQCFPRDMDITMIKELAIALAAHPPYQVPLSCIKIRHLHCQVPDSEILYSLNATIVGLAVSSDQSANLPWCLGLGIVRGIDSSKGLLYIITPVAPTVLENVDILLQGFIQIPISLLQYRGCISPYMSTNVLPAI